MNLIKKSEYKSKNKVLMFSLLLISIVIIGIIAQLNNKGISSRYVFDKKVYKMENIKDLTIDSRLQKILDLKELKIREGKGLLNGMPLDNKEAIDIYLKYNILINSDKIYLAKKDNTTFYPKYGNYIFHIDKSLKELYECNKTENCKIGMIRFKSEYYIPQDFIMGFFIYSFIGLLIFTNLLYYILLPLKILFLYISKFIKDIINKVKNYIKKFYDKLEDIDKKNKK